MRTPESTPAPSRPPRHESDGTITPEHAEQELSRLKELQATFFAASEASRVTGDRSRAKALKQELESRMASLQERVFPLERELGLREQYASRTRSLEAAGILDTLPGGTRGIRTIDGAFAPLPSHREVMAAIREHRAILEEKMKQGFMKLLLVPFGMSLDDLSQRYGDRLLAHHAQGTLFAAKAKDTDPDEPLDLDTAQPLWRWDAYAGADHNGALVYDPKEFSANHGGATKAEILAARGGGWRILFVEADPLIPRAGKGTARNGRTPLEANETPAAYLQKIGTASYAHESGMTPEDWLTLAVTTLEERNQALDDWQGSIAYLTGAYFPASGDVPGANWSRGNRQAVLSYAVPGYRVEDFGVRSAVRVYG